MVIHAVAKMAEDARGLRNRFVVEHPPREGVVPQPHGGAFVFENLDVLRGGGARDHQPYGVRSRVDRCQLDRGGHSQRQRCCKACEGL